MLKHPKELVWLALLVVYLEFFFWKSDVKFLSLKEERNDAWLPVGGSRCEVRLRVSKESYLLGEFQVKSQFFPLITLLSLSRELGGMQSSIYPVSTKPGGE